MPLRNLTNNSILSKNTSVCTNFSKFIGLMLSKNKKRALIFKFSREKIIALHMLFVFYPIDVLFLNEDKIVVDKKEKFNPFTFYKSKKKAMYAVELPDGSIKKSKTEIGDKIGF